MSGDTSTTALNLSSEEKRAYGQFFQQADPENLGVVTGDVAVKFFERTKLDPIVLGEIWQISDKENRGLLTPAGFSVALRLIGHCQAGKTPSPELATRPGPLPRFDGGALLAQNQRPATPQSLNPQMTGSSTALNPQLTGSAPALNPQTTGGGGAIRVPPLTPDKVNEYQILFEKAGARDGILGGDAAKQMFEKAKLPNEVLGRIWNLADSEQRGALTLTEFTIAMHLLTSMRNGSLRALPQNVPPGLHEAANRKTPLPTASAAIARQFTGSENQRAQSPTSRAFGASELAPQSTGSDWLVTPQDKIKFDQMFATIDRAGIGHINGDQAVQFFSNSGLSEDTLATVWDLADIRSEGQLNRDEFAVAMYLIRQQRGTKDDKDNLPSTLPPRLMPPSLRHRSIPPSQPTAPTFDNAAFASQHTKSASEDLFGLDAFATEAPPPIAPKSSVPTSVQAPASPALRSPPPVGSSNNFKPFMPTSSFGQGLTTQHTGGSIQSNATQSRALPRQPPIASDDLLGDNDPEISSKLTEETSELANMSNQVGTLRTQGEELQTKRFAAENNLSATSNQKRELEARLAQFRTQYEREVREVKSLEERLITSRSETRRLQQESAMIEGTRQDLQNQHKQVAEALTVDQRENASLKELIRQANVKVAELRPELEKLRSDARQQKGLVAINKKQLATVEGERDKLQSDMTEVKMEQAEIAATLEAQQAALESETAARQAQQAAFEAETASLETQRAQLRSARAALEAERAALPPVASPTHEAQRAAIEVERADIETQRADLAVQRATPAPVTSPALSVASPSTNPFFRAAPQPTLDRAMSPSVFANEFGNSHATNDFDSFFEPSQRSETETKSVPLTSGALHAQQFEQASHVSENGSVPQTSSQSRQIASSFLPFRNNLNRSESFGSSVKANPSASMRGGMSDIATPNEFPSSPSTSMNGEAGYGQTRQQQAYDNAPGMSAEESNEGTSNANDPGARRNERRQPRRQESTIPGAFPGTPMHSTPTGGSTASERSYAEPETATKFATSEQFVATPSSPSHTETRDFEEAETKSKPSLQTGTSSGFDSYSNTLPNVSTSNGTDRSATEFPPIQEFNASDDSDSDYDEAVHERHHGNDFDDDFFSAAPATHHESGPSAATDGQSGPDHPLVSNLAVAEVDSPRSSLPPTPNAQMPPPTYNQTIPPAVPGEEREANRFPPEFGGLLPSREIMASPPLEVPQTAPQALSTVLSHDEVPSSSLSGAYKPISGPYLPPTTNWRAADPAPASSGDDFDSAFDDLDEAKEADDQGPDSFVIGGEHREEAEFNPAFDSPAPSSRATTVDYQQTPRSTFGNSFNPTSRPGTSFGAFEPNFGTSTSSARGYQIPQPGTFISSSPTGPSFGASALPQPVAQSTVQPLSQPAASHDWDAMFAGLDKSSTAGQSNGSKDPFAFENDGPSTSRDPFAFDKAAPSAGRDTFASEKAAPSASRAPPTPSQKRPVTGRALTTGTEHDDPILKSLTSMGYSRDAALKALEQFDYNIDKAVDYLSARHK